MRKKLIIQKLLTGKLFFIAALINVSFANEIFNPHMNFTTKNINAEQCLSCHKTLPEKQAGFSGKYVIPDMSHYAKSETRMCADCHSDDTMSHIVGSTPEYIVPADLPLDKNKQITCLTCHYIHGSLVSDEPMASTSFMDHLFNRQRLTKSYILRRNNAKGDLCLACHSKQ